MAQITETRRERRRLLPVPGGRPRCSAVPQNSDSDHLVPNLALSNCSESSRFDAVFFAEVIHRVTNLNRLSWSQLGRGSSACVFPFCYRLEVLGVDASTVTTEVVNVEPCWDRPDVVLVKQPVRRDDP